MKYLLFILGFLHITLSHCRSARIEQKINVLHDKIDKAYEHIKEKIEYYQKKHQQIHDENHQLIENFKAQHPGKLEEAAHKINTRTRRRARG